MLQCKLINYLHLLFNIQLLRILSVKRILSGRRLNSVEHN